MRAPLALAACGFGASLALALGWAGHGPDATAQARGQPLPAGSIIHAHDAQAPRQILKSEQEGGKQSFLVAFGNALFSSSRLYGETAKAAGISCNGCHINGDVNRAFFIPGLSARPGGLDTTSHLFNPAADNKNFDPVDIPSLRGIRLTAPYGRDGRVASLREFTRNVIVLEFGGPEPTALQLDALVAYMNEFEFLPNNLLLANGRLAPSATPAAKRGEALFNRPFAGMGGQACASCHGPAANFIDRLAHDVGSGGSFDTPTLRNVAFTAPYFHDGRYPDLAAVIEHFDRTFALHLSAAEKADLLAYLEAVGGGEDGFEKVTARGEMAELASYVGAIDTSLALADSATTRLIVDTVNDEIARIALRFPDGDAEHQARRPDRRKDKADYPALIQALNKVAALAESGDIAGAQKLLAAYKRLAGGMFQNYPDQ